MTYYVLSGMLNATHSLTLSCCTECLQAAMMSWFCFVLLYVVDANSTIRQVETQYDKLQYYLICVKRINICRNVYSSTDLNLLDSRSLEPQVKTVVAQASNLGMTFLVADANNRNLCSFDQLYQLLKVTATINILHYDNKCQQAALELWCFQHAYSCSVFLVGDLDPKSRSYWPSFWWFISRSVHARLQVSVCSSYDLFHPG